MNDLELSIYYTFIYESRWKIFLSGLMMTLILTLTSFLFGSLLGALFCAIRFSKNKTIAKIANAINQFMVQLPTLVLLMVFVYLIFGQSSISTTIVAIIGLTMKTAAYMCDIFYSAVIAVNPGEIEAARALGMNATQAFLNVTLPQAVKNGLSLYQNQFVSCLQETSIVGTLAITDLTKASSIVTSRTLDALFCLISISILYILIGYFANLIIGVVGKEHHLGDKA